MSYYEGFSGSETVRLNPICGQFSVPRIPAKAVEGFEAVYSVVTQNISPEAVALLDDEWSRRGWTWLTTNEINGQLVTFLIAKSAFRTQEEADADYRRLCSLNTPSSFLGHVRYNPVSEVDAVRAM